jgi:hypothetical protein
MEDIASLLNNEEKLLLRAEELYEEDVELKSRNNPTLSRVACAKQFWSKMRLYLPKETVQNLTDLMNKRRTMREQSLRKALKALQKEDPAPGRKRSLVVPDTAVAKTPRKKRTPEANVVSGEVIARSKIYVKRILKHDAPLPSPVMSATPPYSVDAMEKKTPKQRMKRRVTPLPVDLVIKSPENTAAMPPSNDAFEIKSEDPKDDYFRRIDFSVFSPQSKTFYLQIQLMYHDFMASGTRDADEFWIRMTRQYPDADFGVLCDTLPRSSKPKHPKSGERCVRIYSNHEIAGRRVAFFDTPDRGTYL